MKFINMNGVDIIIGKIIDDTTDNYLVDTNGEIPIKLPKEQWTIEK